MKTNGHEPMLSRRRQRLTLRRGAFVGNRQQFPPLEVLRAARDKNRHDHEVWVAAQQTATERRRWWEFWK